MEFSVTDILETPTIEEFELLKKVDLIGLGLHFKLAVKTSMRKQEIEVIIAKKLLQEEIFSSYDFPEEKNKMSQYEFELEKIRLQLEYEEREKDKERLSQDRIHKEEKSCKGNN